MWRWCHWFPALVGSSNAEWLESAGKCLAARNTNALVSEWQLKRKCLSPLCGGRIDLLTDWLTGWVRGWVAGWISHDGHVRSELSDSPVDWACPGLRVDWEGEKTNKAGKKTDKEEMTSVPNTTSTTLASCLPSNDWQREMKTNDCIFQTAAGKSKNGSLSNPRPGNYTAEQTCTPLLTACNRCRTDGNRWYKPTYENEISHNVTTAASLRWKCITANSKICDWTNSKCAAFDKRIS